MQSTPQDATTCCIVGCGPAGAVLGLLLARAGVDVLVLEKHEDFFRDFRGDTIHTSTLDVLDELGLGDRFADVPQQHVAQMRALTDNGMVTWSIWRSSISSIPISPSFPSGTSLTS